MRPHQAKTMVRSLLVAIALLTASDAALAQNNPTSNPGSSAPHSAAEERACGSDARRFCKDAIGDDFRVGSCLQEHRTRLSRACRIILEGHGM
jgi:hypothetical protein